MTTWTWTTVDFRPDPSGWRAIFLNYEPGNWTDHHGWHEVPIAGWLIQHERPDPPTWVDPDRVDAPAFRDARVVAGIVLDDEITPAASLTGYWFLAAPGEDPSDDANPEDEVEHRRDIDRRLAERRRRFAQVRAARADQQATP